MDVVDHREFYSRALGRNTLRLVADALRPLASFRPGQLVVGMGFAAPYLDRLVPETCTAIAFMQARQGVIHWPRDGDVRSALVDEYDLPLLESVADHVLLVHGLERADDPLDMLKEIWRVLAPQGRLLLVVPNRRGFWSASDASPFGFGQPFSRSQIMRLLKEAQFSVLQARHALFMPPTSRPMLLRASSWFERSGSLAVGRFAGITIIEAGKQVYAFSAGKRARRLMPRLQPVLLPAPHPTSRLPDPS